MKKLSIFLLGALAFAATSCEDGPSVPPVQTNPQGPVLEVNGVTAAQNPASNVVDLQAKADAGENIPLADFQLASFPEGYTLAVEAELSKSENFATSTALPVSLIDNVAVATPDDFENAYVSTVSKSPAAKDVYVRFAPYAVKGNEKLRIGAPDNFIGPFVMNVTPYPSDLVIEDAYYLLGTVNGWSVATALKFNHSDLSGYDDPVFSIVVDITPEQAESGWWWKIIPQSTYKTGDWVDAAYSSYGPEENGSEDAEGMLFASTVDEEGNYVDSKAGMFTEYGTYMITIDMIEGTYDFTLAIPELYVQGDAAGWNWESPLVATLSTTDYINYSGYSLCKKGGYKFTSEKSWSAAYDLGVDGDVAPEDGWTLAGKLSNGSLNNIVPAEDGLYYHHVNITALTFQSYLVTTLGVIGDATPGGWSDSTPLTPSADLLVWEGDIEFAASGSFKIRANDDWKVNLGGSLDNLTQDGDNLPTPGAGVHHIVLDLSTSPYTLTID